MKLFPVEIKHAKIFEQALKQAGFGNERFLVQKHCLWIETADSLFEINNPPINVSQNFSEKELLELSCSELTLNGKTFAKTIFCAHENFYKTTEFESLRESLNYNLAVTLEEKHRLEQIGNIEDAIASNSERLIKKSQEWFALGCMKKAKNIDAALERAKAYNREMRAQYKFISIQEFLQYSKAGMDSLEQALGRQRFLNTFSDTESVQTIKQSLTL